MKSLVAQLAVALLSSQLLIAQAADCDCTKTLASCTVGFQVKNITGLAGSSNHAAEVHLTSSQASCSKISFYVDSTPYIAVLNSGNTAIENVFGTSPISQNTVSIDYCRVCAEKAQTNAESSQQLSPTGSRFNAALGADFDKSQASASTSAAVSYQDRGAETASAILDGLLMLKGAVDQRPIGSTSMGTGLGVGSQLPAHCRNNVTAKGCPYYSPPIVVPKVK